MITFIQKKIRKFLGGPGNPPSNIVDIKTEFSGQLVRDDSFKQYFNQWKQSKNSREMLNGLYGNYLNGEPLEDSVLAIDLHQAPGANGFSVHSKEESYNPNADELRCLMDLFREKTIALQYRPYSSTFEEKTRVDHTIRKERHYLKPWSGSTEMPMEQLYGNITIELELKNGEAEQLKVMATYYTGFNYRPAASFDNLISKLLSSK